jgi:hypothetical protein
MDEIKTNLLLGLMLQQTTQFFFHSNTSYASGNRGILVNIYFLN